MHKKCDETEATSQAMTTAEMVHNAAAKLPPHHASATPCTEFPSGQAELPRGALHLPVQMS